MNGVFIRDSGEGLTSSTTIRVTGKASEARGILCKYFSKLIYVPIVIGWCSPSREVNGR
jgi:hypothetical protein